eukprot:scaffold7832_cov267-Pinguiococcus_pyrenoidosus.AAC.7
MRSRELSNLSIELWLRGSIVLSIIRNGVGHYSASQMGRTGHDAEKHSHGIGPLESSIAASGG